MVESKLTPMIEAVCLSADKAAKVIFNNDTYAKITYDEKHFMSQEVVLPHWRFP